MGIVKVDISIANSNDPSRRREVKGAIVDTGASYTTIPKSLAADLGLKVIGKRRVTTANGVTDVEHSFALVEYDGHISVGDVMISSTYPGVLLGALTLEGMALAVDPKSGKLVDSELLLL
jgi:aspartyl protease family protein